MITEEVVSPGKYPAHPTFPPVQVTDDPLSVPLFPILLISYAIVPLPSSKFQYPTSHFADIIPVFNTIPLPLIFSSLLNCKI